jgi:hypothetical protein
MSASSRVRLELEFLDADQAAPASPQPVGPDDEQNRQTVLVVAGEADFRGYVRECLRERADLRVLQTATVASAVTVAAEVSLALIVVDEPERHVVAALSHLRAIVIVDDVPRGSPSAANVRSLVRPFTAEGLLAEVRQLLG